jgi:hypothetical protein
MEAARTSETSVDIQLRTRQYIPEDSELHKSTCFVLMWTGLVAWEQHILSVFAKNAEENIWAQEKGKNSTDRTVVRWSASQFFTKYWGDKIKVCTVHVICTKQMHTKFYAVNLKEKAHLQDQGVDGTAVSMQLKFILRCEGLAGSGQSPVDRPLFRGISWPVELPLPLLPLKKRIVQWS